MAPPASEERTLEETPTWAVALVCAVFVIISVLIEHGIHSLGKWFQKRNKKAMSEALEKIKAELMLLGFISLLITVGTNPIAKICISKKAGGTMLPCKKGNKEDTKGKDGGATRRLMSYAEDAVWRRVLAPAGGDEYCSKDGKGKVPLISATGLHQLHIFIFVLAVFHVLYSVITIALAQAKMKSWKAWEKETDSMEYQFTNDPSRFRFTHQLSFIKRHTGMSTVPGLRWIVAFFRQFFASVTKVDYLTLRHGFINTHFAPNSKFDFHKYIKRSMEDDFKVVVGISIPLWTFAVIFQLVNVYKWYTLSWISFVPLAMILLIGAKLEVIIMDMAQQIRERTTVVNGAPVIEPSNKYFWFNRPRWILSLIHFTLFQNAFQMAYFLWTWYEFGLTSCFHENIPVIITRVALGVVLQFICSYVTFPLYSFVTQMGSHMKTAIFEEQTAKGLRNWQKAAKDRKKLKKARGGEGVSSTGFRSGASTPRDGSSSPVHLLHNHKARSTMDIESAVGSPNYHSETDLSEIEGTSPHSGDDLDSRRHNNQNRQVEPHNGGGFSFVKL